MQMLQCNFTQQTKTPVLRRFFCWKGFYNGQTFTQENALPLPFEWFNYNVLKNFAAVEIKGETRIKTQTIPLLKPTAKQNVLRKRRIVFSACAFFLLTQDTAIKFCWNCNLRKKSFAVVCTKQRNFATSGCLPGRLPSL